MIVALCLLAGLVLVHIAGFMWMGSRWADDSFRVEYLENQADLAESA